MTANPGNPARHDYRMHDPTGPLPDVSCPDCTTPRYRALDVTIDGDTAYPCVVALGDGSQPMAPMGGWDGNPIPRWNGWVAEPRFDRDTVERLRVTFDGWRAAGGGALDSSWIEWQCADCGEGSASGGSMAGYVHRYGPVAHGEYRAVAVVHDPVAEADYGGHTYCERIEPDADGRYAIGAYGWTWYEWDESGDCEGYNVGGRWIGCDRPMPHAHGIIADMDEAPMG